MTRAPTEMELRVAKAIDHVREQNGGQCWEAHSLKYQSLVLAEARAAIRAMREPTPEMVAKLRTIAMPEGPTGRNWYQAGIDAALPPEEGEVVGPAGLEPATRPL